MTRTNDIITMRNMAGPALGKKQIVGLLLFALAGFAGLAGVLTYREGLWGNRPSREGASPRSQKRLGGGYKGAKWGMSKDEVRRIIVGTIKDEGDNYLTIGLDGGKEVDCWFWNGRLAKVKYSPKLQDGDVAGYKAVLQALAEKYGDTKASPGYVNSANIPLDVFEWKDGETEISFEMMSKAAAERVGIELPTSTVHVVYTSEQIEAERKASEARARKNEADKMINAKKAAVTQDL